MKNEIKNGGAGKNDKVGNDNKTSKDNEVKKDVTANDQKELNPEEFNTIINDGTSKNSTGANINTQRLAQDDNYTIISETSEEKRNKELLNEPYVGAADQGKQSSIAGEVVTMGEKSIEDQDDLGIVMGTEADVTDEDLLILGDKDQDQDGGDDEMYAKAGLDDTDFDGEPLNEAASDMSTTGDDLDMPEEEPKSPKGDALEQGDEENDYYSLGSDINDEVVEGTP